MKIIGATKLQNVVDVCNFLQTSMDMAHFTYIGTQWQVEQYFHEIELGDIDHTHGYEAHKFDGSRSKYVIKFVFHLKKTLLHVRKLSYFCKFYMDGGDGPCDKCTHVQPWNLVALGLYPLIDIRCNPETKIFGKTFMMESL